MSKSYIADKIMNDYFNKKRYNKNKRRSELEEFKRKNCVDCKNKHTDICSIHKNINGDLQCLFKRN